MAEFRVTLKCIWDKDTGKIKKLNSADSNGTDDNFSLRMEADEIDEKENGDEDDGDNEMDDSNGD